MSSIPPTTEELQAQILELRERVETLEQHLVQQRVVNSPVTVNYSVALPSALPPAGESVASTAAVQPPVAPSGGSTSRSAEHSDAQRIEIATGVGRYLRRALDGDHLATSGRDQLRLASRVYILVRDIRGTLYNPVQIHRAFSTLRPLVKDSSGGLGDSIFVGLPTIWEAKLAVQAASLSWPPDA